MLQCAAIMSRFTPLCLIPALFAAVSHAVELPIEQRPFVISKSIPAVVIPAAGGVPIRLEPKAWKDFEIKTIADNGAVVAKDDVLLAFETESIDRKLDDLRRDLQSAEMAVAQGELDLRLLGATGPAALEAARRAAEIAKEENAYFTKTRRKATEESAAQELKRREQGLENQREELRQLEKMYAADDVVEETEEIVLTRQKDAVASAEFGLRMGVLSNKRTLEVQLPREAQSLADAERDAGVALEKAADETPRTLATKKLDLAAKKIGMKRVKEELADLEADRKLFEFKAPAPGIFYHGTMEQGRWVIGEMAKALVSHGHPPAFSVIATFVPTDAALGLTAFVDEATARSLQPEQAGIATMTGREEIEIPVKLVKLATIPGADGNRRADFSATWPAEFTPAAGATATIRAVTYEKPAAIVVPSKALDFGSAGWTVEVRVADGKNERRPVKRGRVSGEDTEILSGLEAGQVILVP